MTAVIITESGEAGPFSGAGPHSMPTHLSSPAAARYAMQANFRISDDATNEIYYVGRCALTKKDATTVAVTAQAQWFPAVGSGGAWDGTVLVSAASLIDDELVIGMTMPGGYTTNVSYRLEGL